MTKPKTLPPSKGGPTYADPAREAAERLFSPRPAKLTPDKMLPPGATPPAEMRPAIRREVRRSIRAAKGDVVVEQARATATLDRLGAALARLTRAEAGGRAVLDDVAARLAALEDVVARLAAGETTTATRAVALVEEATEAARRITEAASAVQPVAEPEQLDLVDLLEAADTTTGRDLAQEGPAALQGEPVAADPEPARHMSQIPPTRPQALPFPFDVLLNLPTATPAR